VWRQAQRLEVSGWVRNRHDGTVEVLADATAGEHSKLLEMLRQGPSLSRVSRVDWADEAREIEDLVGFAVAPDA
jgi:acylphosphatase